MLNTPGVQCTPVSIHCGQLRNIRLVPRAQRVSIFIFTHPECWESVISDVSKSVSREEKLSLLLIMTWCCQSPDEDYTFLLGNGPIRAQYSGHVTCPGQWETRTGPWHSTLTWTRNYVFQIFSWYSMIRVFRKMTFILEANLNGQIIGLSNFFHRKLLHSGVLRVNLSNFS